MVPYKIGRLLYQDFTSVCRFGGEFEADADDPNKVLFRYVNCPKFLKEGICELDMAEVDMDMMRRYADSFDNEDFVLTLSFENVDDERFGSRGRRRKENLVSPGYLLDRGTKFNGHVPHEETDMIFQGFSDPNGVAWGENDVNNATLQLILEPLAEENDFKPGASLSSVGTNYDLFFDTEVWLKQLL